MIESRMLIDGRLVPALSGRTFAVTNPANGALVGAVADADEADMIAAIEAARRAFDTSAWSRDAALRLRGLTQLRDALLEHREALREIIVGEVGSPVQLTRSLQLDWCIEDMQWDLDFLAGFGWVEDLPGVSWSKMPGRQQLHYEAVGVVGLITPWNYPMMTCLAKLIPALSAGNAVVLKPAPDTPLHATFIGRLIVEHTDIPAGIVNVVTSEHPAQVGEVLTTHPLVDMISFTGSTGVGKRIIVNAAATVKKTIMELGGKSARIVLDDVDMTPALAACAGSVCSHAGQGCAITTRLLVPRARYEEVLAILKAVMERMPWGDPADPKTVMGPVINQRQHDRILALIERARAGGARIVTGGVSLDHGGGFYVAPTVIADVDPDAEIAQTEIFGPVLVVLPYDTDDDAVAIANQSDYGLAASVVGADFERALAIARRLRVGAVSVNGNSFKSAAAPYGGYKQSGLGREYGALGFKEYLEVKVIGLPV
jgi:aldehyde dehydrogenase (NAD+)